MDKKTDLRVLRTRSSINKAFLTLLKQKSYSKITIQEIADEAFISRNTFYLHYLDKEDLFEKFIDKNLEQLRESMRGNVTVAYSLEAFGYDNFFESVKLLFIIIKENFEIYHLILIELSSSYVTKQFTEMIVTHIIEGLEITQENNKASRNKIRIYAEYMASGLIGLIKYWMKNKDEYSIDEVSQIIVDMYSQDVFQLIGKQLTIECE